VEIRQEESDSSLHFRHNNEIVWIFVIKTMTTAFAQGHVLQAFEEHCTADNVPLVSLTADLVPSLLRDWVDINSLGAFDSACCSYDLRPQYASIVRSESFVHDTMYSGYDEDNQVAHVELLTKRGVRTRTRLFRYPIPPVLLLNLRGTAPPASQCIITRLTRPVSTIRSCCTVDNVLVETVALRRPASQRPLLEFRSFMLAVLRTSSSQRTFMNIHSTEEHSFNFIKSKR
jgi:hypothetical protein